MARPGSSPSWATSGAIVTSPTAAKKAKGWITSEKPPAQFMNWLFNLIYLWISYFDERAIKPKVSGDGSLLFTYSDFAGNIRSFVSPNGYPQGPTMHFHEPWMEVVGGSGTNTGVNTASWEYVGSQAGGSSVSAASVSAGGTTLGTTYPLPVGKNFSAAGNVVGNFSLLRGVRLSFLASASVSAEMLMDIGVSNDNATSNRNIAAWGFSTDLSNPGTSAEPSILVIADRSIGPNWVFYASDGSNGTVVDTGFPIQANNMLSARIELLGANSDYGRCAKLWLGGTSFVITTTLPAVDLGMIHGFCLKRTTAGGTPVDVNQYTGPIQLNINNGFLGIV